MSGLPLTTHSPLLEWGEVPEHGSDVTGGMAQLEMVAGTGGEGDDGNRKAAVQRRWQS